jgi:hypothetical protein
MRSIFIALASLCFLCAFAAAQEPQWSDVSEAEGIHSVFFGVPQSDDVRFFMSCTREGDAVETSWHVDVDKPTGMQPGLDGMRQRLENQRVEIRFADGDRTTSETLNAAFQPEEMTGGIFIEIHVPKNAPVLEKFRSSSDAALILPGVEPQTLDLKGADASIGKLLNACSG